MGAFVVRQLSKPGVLRRLLGGKQKENCFIEIENRCATTSLKDLTAADVEHLLSEYEIPRDAATPHLMALYETALREAVRDLQLSEQDAADLKHLRYVFGLDEVAAQDAETQVLRSIYRDQLKKALDDRHLSAAEKQSLENLGRNFGLTDAIIDAVYKQEVREIVQHAFNQAIADRRLTAEEEQGLAAMAKNLGVTWTHDADSEKLVERYRLLAEYESGALPVVVPPVLLQKAELCHAAFPSELHEYRTVTKAYRYVGPAGRIRIMKGLSWRYGSVSINRVTSEELRQLDSGVLYITNKRLLYNGGRKNVNTPLKKILTFTLHKDGIKVEKETGYWQKGRR